MAIEQYRQYIRHLLSERRERASRQYNAQEYEVQTLFDSEQDHYQLLYVGWRGNKRDFGCILHLDIKGEKIWIQHDGTEIGIANQLVELGVPKEDIVLAFHEPEIRQFTDFGTGEVIREQLPSVSGK
ncbi:MULTISPECIES: XisI protein [unclassified Microcoleus]|uniref:XisI protein n=1 Tax=unclassified Microcoleus TaxID=2642155 RepID=UPI0025FDBB3B|nr:MULTISPECIES: XisI protein [unclassified Microcoleus]